MRKLAVCVLTLSFLTVISTIPKYISADFYAFYQEVVEFALIFILTEKFTDWVFKDRGKSNEHD